MKTQPQRMCLVCRQMHDKRDLLRIVKNANGDVFVDKTNKAGGRGAYICMSDDCLSRLKKPKQLSRALACELSQEDFERLLEDIKNCKNKNSEAI